MSDCPPWVESEADSQVPSVAAALVEFQRFVYKNSKTHILDHGDLKTWHGKIFFGSVPVRYYAGHYRCDDGSRPCLQQNVQVGGVPGAPFADVPRLMREWSDDLHDRIVETDRFIADAPTPVNRARSVLQLAAVFCGRFLQIHPFLNGNGRTSRLIVNYLLHRYGYPMPYYNPFPRPGVPYGQASAASMRGDFIPLYQYLLGLLAGMAS